MARSPTLPPGAPVTDGASTGGPEAPAREGAPDLARLRAAIDAIDDEILDRLNRRALLARDVATWKEQHARPFYVPDRERAIVDRLTVRNQEAEGAFPTAGVKAVFGEIISACLSLEKRLRVGFLGPEATFTHQAARSRFGLSALYLPAATIAGVFAEVEKGAADVGVVPVENTSEGMVNHTHDVFMESELVVQQEICIPVSQNLLSRAPSMASVRKVYSHPQALAQCRRFLASNLAGAALIEVASTALAAQLCKDDPQSAAVASELAAQLYDIPVLRARVEDERVNMTRFLVIARPDTAAARLGPTGNDKTSVMFTLQDRPGGLHAALLPFAARGVNLNRIESRPSRRRAWDYVFFIDIDGHAEDPAVRAAIEDFRPDCALVKVLGSYPRAEIPVEVTGDTGPVEPLTSPTPAEPAS